MGKQLPKNWVECQLKDISDIVTGSTPSKSFPEYYGGDIPWVKPGDINKSIEIFETEVYLSDEGFNKSRKIPANSIMVTCIGNLGNIAIAGTELATNQQINTIVINHQLVDKKYTYYYSFLLKPWLIENSTSTTISMVNKSNFEKAPFILPPLAEQFRIVNKLDTLFAQLETMKTSMAKVPLLLRDFRQQVLTQAVTGKLTEEWRKGKELEEWKTFKMGDIISSIQSGKSFLCPEIPVTEGQVGLVKISAVSWEVFDQSKTKTVTDKTKIFPEYFIKKGDFLMSRANTLELVGASVIVGKIDYDIMLSDKVWRINFKNHNNKIFLNYFLKSKEGRKEIESKATGNQESMRNLSQNNFKDINIKLPLIAEEQLIVSRVESLFAKAAAIEQQYENLKATIETLPQAILHKAFKGELTEQLESDGDARDLLKEIQKLKAETSKVVKKKVVSKKVKVVYSESDEVLDEVAEAKNINL